MRRMHRIVLLAGLVALAPVLAGCEDFDMDKLDVFHLNEKKKLPGERKALFPEGVPGVTQGIPPEYLKGNQPPPDAALQRRRAPANSRRGRRLPRGQRRVRAAQPQQDRRDRAGRRRAEDPASAKPKRKPKPQAGAGPAAASRRHSSRPRTKAAASSNRSPGRINGKPPATAPWPAAPPPATSTQLTLSSSCAGLDPRIHLANTSVGL